ncbi:MAG: alkyl sulfatase dimerization domain-containing protein [Sphingobium sp.]
MATMRKRRRWLYLAMLLAPPPAFASVYDGDPVEIVTMDNGARVNAKMARHVFMLSDPRIVRVNDKVWSITSYALANCTFVETQEGIVVFDTGSNVGQGRYFLSQIRAITQKPIIAIIYSHAHYMHGTSAMIEESAKPPLVIAHPDLAASSFLDVALERSRWRRGNLQFGAYLPERGADARATTPEPAFADPASRKSGFVPVSRPVQDGETLELGGLTFRFLWTVADTKDSLSVWIPELQTVLTNSVAAIYYPLYTLRGEVYRNPEEIIAGYDRLRALRPAYYAPVHGSPLIGREEVDRVLTLHRDAYAFTYNQAIRAINLGWTPDQMVDRIRLPHRFRKEPSLAEVYSEFPYALRGIYRGLVGWFDEDTAQLNPPSRRRLGEAIVSGFGGIDALLRASAVALAGRQYALAATLAGYAVDAQPDNRTARQARANALRQLATVSKGMQSHNFYLTEALALEGRVDRFALPAAPAFPRATAAQFARLPPEQLVRTLESRIDPQRSSAVFTTYVIDLGETGLQFDVAVRDGVAQVSPHDEGISGTPIRLSRAELASLLVSEQGANRCTASTGLCRFRHMFGL